MRFCVRRLDVCPGEERRTLRKSAFCNPCRTEKRILAARSHGKTHSAGVALPKGALCATARAQTAPFRETQRTECTFPSRRRPEGAQGNRPPECGALWKTAQLGKCARATARQTAGGLRQVIPSPREVRTTTAHNHDRLEASKKGHPPCYCGCPKDYMSASPYNGAAPALCRCASPSARTILTYGRGRCGR